MSTITFVNTFMGNKVTYRKFTLTRLKGKYRNIKADCRLAILLLYTKHCLYVNIFVKLCFICKYSIDIDLVLSISYLDNYFILKIVLHESFYPLCLPRSILLGVLFINAEGRCGRPSSYLWLKAESTQLPT